MAETALFIQVDNTHIDAGIAGDDGACPLALALNDTDFFDSSVGTIRAHATGIDLEMHCFSLPAPTVDFIKEFDGGGCVAPCVLQLDPIPREAYHDIAFNPLTLYGVKP